ncbi:hypothetical protein HPB51_026428 [Rhipicephalus microplus]|uniref:Uncharacterized protein n=1 Tax=Rhipicephalus microplus TaxID=6941 RepID=A0A9J6D365_RHIMP|nr:hypothetical protein HPB51_026428 [Rhipicephalus microplus]
MRIVVVIELQDWGLAHVAEHSYAVLDTPKTLKRKLDACTDSAATVKRKLKLSLERERRLRRKVSSFNEIIDDLKHKQLISEDASAMLERDASGASVSWDYIVRYKNFKKKKACMQQQNYVLHTFSGRTEDESQPCCPNFKH